MYQDVSTFESFSVFTKPLAEKIWSLAALPDGWNFGSGRSIAIAAILAAIRASQSLDVAGIPEQDVFPLDEGGVLLRGYPTEDAKDLIEIFVSAAGALEVAFDADDDLHEIGIEELTAALLGMGEEWLKSYDFCTLSTSTADWVNMPALLSQSLTMGEYPSSSRIVSIPDLYASI